MKLSKLFGSIIVATGLVGASSVALACASGTKGFTVHNGTKDTYYVNAYAGNGKYNKTNKVQAEQSQEFCWNANYGGATVTKTNNNDDKWQYKWAVPAKKNVYYKNIYINSGNWDKQ